MARLFHAAAIGRGPEDFELGRPDGRGIGDMSLCSLTTLPELPLFGQSDDCSSLTFGPE